MSKKPQPSKPLKVVETFANFDEESQEDSANILQKVQFIGENYNFVQKEIQEILTRSEANEQKAQEYRDQIEDLNNQVEKERAYAKKLVNECQELRAGFYDMETRLSDTTEKHASLQLMEKELRIAVKKYKAEAADSKKKSETALGKGKKVYQMLEDSKKQTAQLTQQLHSLRKQWTDEVEKLRKENAAFKSNTGQIKKDYESAESKLWQVIDENKKIIIENRKLQSIFQQKDAAVNEMKSQLQARQTVVESRDRKIQQLQEEIQNIHAGREELLKTRTGELYDQVDSLKKICQRLRTELKSKSAELVEIRDKWKTFERVHRTEPAKRIQDLEKSQSLLKKQLDEKSMTVQKLREQEYRYQEEGRKVARLEEEIQFLKDHVEEARSHTADKAQQLNDLIIEKHKIDQELSLAKTRAAEAEGKKQLMEQNLEELKSDFSQRQKKFEEESTASQKAVNELQVKVSQLEMEARYLGDNRSQLSQENEKFSARLVELQSENDALKQKNEQDISFWKNQLAQTETAKQKIQAQLDSVQSEITRSRARLQDVIEAGERQKSDYEDFIHEQRGVIQSLEEQIGKEDQQISDLKQANATLQDRLDVLQKRYESETDSWEQEEFQLRQQITQLTAEHVRKDGELSEKSQALAELTLKVREESQRREMDLEQMQARLNLAQERLESTELEFREKVEQQELRYSADMKRVTEEADHKFLTMKTHFESQQQDREAEYKKSLEGQRKQLYREISQLKEAHSDKVKSLEATHKSVLSSETAIRDEKIKIFEAQLKDAERERKQFSEEVSLRHQQEIGEISKQKQEIIDSIDAQWKTEVAQLEADKQRLVEELNKKHDSELSELTARHGDIVHKLQTERDRIQKELESSTRDRSEESTRKEVEWENEKKALQATINQLQKQNSELSRERTFEDEYENRLRLQYEEAQKKLSELRGRETQISNYSRLVDEQKFKLRKFADDLAGEVTGLQVLNPLKDYLEITNKEIREVELALSKTPALAAERKPMEQHFEKLVTQRDHLQKSLTESRQALQKKAKAVKDICRRAVLIPLPPLPPNSDDVEIS